MIHKMKRYVKVFVVWTVLSCIVGIASGFVGALFHKAIELATHLRGGNPWLLYLLPIGGLFIAWMYHFSKQSLSTNTVIDCIRDKKAASPFLAPFIFIGAFVTHLLGGSAGREGAALQIGGGIGSEIGKALKLDDKKMSTVIVCGMSGAFSAIFTTPVTAAVFALELVNVGHMNYFRLYPAVLSAAVAFKVTVLLKNPVLFFDGIAIPSIGVKGVVLVSLFAVAAALLSTVFCVALHNTEHLFDRFLKNTYVKAAAGGVIIILLTLLSGSRDYNGAGMNIIEKALSGEAYYGAFLLKLVFTSVTVAAGFKGGEIVPAFFVGTTFGAAFGHLFGLDPAFAAALGLLCMFCGISNCPLASVILGVELFGGEGLLYFALASSVCYVMSGRFGLYSSQRIIYSKCSTDKN